MATAEVHTADYPELVISPPSRWSGLGWASSGRTGSSIYFLTKRELQVRYKQSFFGISWAILQPLVFAFVFALFFGEVLKVTSTRRPPVSGLRRRRHRPLAVHGTGDSERGRQPGSGRGPDLEGLLPAPGAADLEGAQPAGRPGDRAGRGDRRHPDLRRLDRHRRSISCPPSCCSA